VASAFLGTSDDDGSLRGEEAVVMFLSRSLSLFRVFLSELLGENLHLRERALANKNTTSYRIIKRERERERERERVSASARPHPKKRAQWTK